MNIPRFGRELTWDERATLEGGRHATEAFVLRRCQLVLASADGERVPAMAQRVGRTARAVHTVLDAFETRGRDACLRRRSARPHTIHAAVPADQAEDWRALLHQRPRPFGKPTSRWTLDLAAAVSFERGRTATRVTGETIRATVVRLGVTWQRAKDGITRPDPEYAPKNVPATA